MFDDELKQKAKELVDFDGLMVDRAPQSIYILEEMTELSKEILKDSRYKGDLENIKEEMADVLCTILTYAYSKNINIDDLRDIMIQKLDRGISRIKLGEQ